MATQGVSRLAEQAAQVASSGQADVVSGGRGDVDVSKFVSPSSQQEAAANAAPHEPPAPQPIADGGTPSASAIVGEAVGNVAPTAAAAPVSSAPASQARIAESRPAAQEVSSSSSSPVSRQSPSPGSDKRAGRTSAPEQQLATSAASSMQAPSFSPAPALHPSNLVLNASTGLLSGGGAVPSNASPAAQVQLDANELGQDQGESRPQSQRATSSSLLEAGRAATKQAIDDSIQEDVDFVAQETQRQLQSQGRRELLREGEMNAPERPKTLTSANRTFKKIRKLIQEKVNQKLKGESYSGTRFYETIFSMPSLMPHCVSIGTENLYESLREPNSTIVNLVNSKLAEEDPTGRSFLTREQCLADISLLVNAINSMELEVTMDKTPDNINHSIQVRTLRVHYGRGIGLHPTQTKAFNADYDGDPAQINMDQEQIPRFARAMDRLVSSEGYPMIDPDFFPLDRIDDRAEVLDLLQKRNMSWQPGIARLIVDAYIGACNEGDWVGLLRRIDEVADEYAGISGNGSRNTVASAILKSLYDFSIDRRGLMLGAKLDNVARDRDEYLDRVPDGNVDPFVWDLISLHEEIAAGRRPPSLEEFTRFFNKFYGDIRDSEGRSKNVPFRLLADYAKMINRSDLVTVGSSLFGFKLVSKNGKRTLAEDPNAEVSLNDLWQFTCVASLTKQISGRCHTGSRELAVSTQVRSMVLRDCPTASWSNEGEFRNWLSKFRESYNMNMRMLNLAQTAFTGGMRIKRSESSKFDGIGKDYDGIAEALVSVYGQQTVGSMFPSLIRQNDSVKDNSASTIARFYSDMTLEKFSVNNRLTMRSEGDNTASFAGIGRRLKSGKFTQMDILMLIADRRSAQFGEFHDAWLKATSQQFKAGFDARPDGPSAPNQNWTEIEYQEYTDKIMELVATMSPDMFLYYGMDSPASFAKSKYGKRLMEARSLSAYRSTLVSMMVEYRFGKATNMLKEMEAARENSMMGFSQVDRLEDLDAAFENELEILGSSSLVWQAIVSEQMNGSAVFKNLMANGGYHGEWKMYGRLRKAKNKETGEEEVRGFSFWDRPAEEKEKYYSLMNFLKSSEPFEVKLAVLADVARVSNQYANITPEEVLGQLAHHPDRAHAGNLFDMDKGLRGDIKDVKESSALISSYMDKTPEKIRREANKVLKFARKERDQFMAHLLRLANDPGYAVHVDTMLAADAIASIFDKTYSDSEKTKQQAAVNGYFGCVSMQRNGGYYTHLYMSDNAVVNMVGFDQLNAQDIIRILADPTIQLTVYDEFGTPATVSRRKLCGGNTDADVVRFLERNPRIALLCRRQVAGIADDTDGTARVNALNSFGDGVDPIEPANGEPMWDKGLYPQTAVARTFALLNDRPRFLAIAALLTPSDGDVGRNMPERIDSTLKKLCNFVGVISKSELQGIELSNWIGETIGLSEDVIVKLRNEGRFDENDIDEHDLVAARYLYEDVINELMECAEVLKANPDSSSWGFWNVGSELAGRIDQTSMIAYYDARQQISGGRTNVMIGVEGGETKKNLVLKTFLKARPDKYTMSEDGKTVVLVSDGNEPVSDQSLVRDPDKMISSICKFLEVKRENGAETYNAKYKKYGDDGTNSMLKFIRMASREMFRRFGKNGPRNMPNGTWAIEDGAQLLTHISACKTKQEAVEVLAQALIDADIRLGYIDVQKESGQITDLAFIPSDYWNRADLMIAEDAEGNIARTADGRAVVRTLEQISAALRTRLSDDAVVSGNLNQVVAEMEQIVSTLGTAADPMLTQHPDEVAHRCLYGVRLHSSVGMKHRFGRAIRQRSSSTERNYAMLNVLYRNFMASGLAYGDAIPSEATRAELSKRKYREHSGYASQLKGLVFPQDKWALNQQTGKFEEVENPDGDRGRLYDFLGSYKDEDLRLVPGPQSLVLFDNASWFDDLAMDRLQQCLEYGITAAVPIDSLENFPSEYVKNLIPTDTGLWILPAFDILLNGMYSESIVESPAEIPVNPDNLIINAETRTGEFRSGEASYHITKELADRIKVMFRGTETFTADRIFPNVMHLFPRSNFELDYCTREEIQKYVLDADFDVGSLTLKGFDEAVVDIGVPEPHPEFEREKQRFAIRLQEYKEAFESADGDSILHGDLRYDSIVGFVKIKIDKQYTVFAPIWPFHLEESGSVPTSFAVGRDDEGKALFELNHSTNSFDMEWAYTGDMPGQYIKAFEGIGTSTKMIAAGEYARSRELDNGLAIDGFYDSASIASRLFSANKRIYTMISALMITRMDAKYAYNFAESSGAFPGNPTITRPPTDEFPDGEVVDIKSAMMSASLGIKDWELVQQAGIQYHTDPDINRIVKWWVGKCIDFGTVNPNVFLATKTDAGMLWPKITEFEAFMDPGMNFQRAYMKFMHEMNPTLMPADIDGKAKGCLFVPVQKDNSDEDYGVLQMRVPHFDADGNTYYVNENVYISLGFFGEEFSGFKKVNFNGRLRTIDALNLSSRIDGDDLIKLLTFARAGMTDVVPASHLEAVPDNIMVDLSTLQTGVEEGEE